MEMIDIVFDQILNSSSSKNKIRELNDRFKLILAKAMPDDYNEIDLPLDELVNVICTVRTTAKHTTSNSVDIKLLSSMLFFQHIFYSHNVIVDAKTNNYYKYLYYNCKDLYPKFRDEIYKIEHLKFNYELDISQPISNNIKNIATYCNALQILAKSVCKILINSDDGECRGVSPFIVFQLEMIGNEEEWYDQLNDWLSCHIAYKQYIASNFVKAETIRAISDSRHANRFNFKTDVDEMPNSNHKLDRLLKEAEQLIASAAKGTFPY